MIIKTFCNTCLQAYEILVEPHEVELVKDVVNEDHQALCPRMCGGRVLIDAAADLSPVTKALKDPITLSGREFYTAVHGGGMPDEIPKHPDVVNALLRSSSVTGADLEQRFGRIYLTKLHLSGGVVLHFSSGLCGAVIVKITKGQ